MKELELFEAQKTTYKIVEEECKYGKNDWYLVINIPGIGTHKEYINKTDIKGIEKLMNIIKELDCKIVTI